LRRGPGRAMQGEVFRAILCTLGVLVLLLGPGARARAQDPPRTVESVDLGRYVGRWYELARFPNSFQNQCVSDVTATYETRSDGRIDVINRCRTAAGEMDQAVGVARVEDQQSRAKLKVRFAPAYLSFLPFVWGDYWVLALDPAYRWAVVGTPDREFLWILSRDPDLAEDQYAAALAAARAQGFDVSRVMRTDHMTSAPAPAPTVP